MNEGGGSLPGTASREDEAPIRVVMLFSRFPPTYGGGGIQGERLARRLVARGVEVQVLCEARSGSRVPLEEVSDGLRIRRFRIPAFDDERNLWLGLRAAWWLARHDRWDLLHVHGFGYFGVLPTVVARWRGKKVLVKTTLLGGDGVPKDSRWPHRQWITDAYRRVDSVIALSDELEAGFRADPTFRGAVLRLPNGVDASLFAPVDAAMRREYRERLRVPADAFVVFSAGQLDARKRVADIVEAAGLSGIRPVCVALAGPESRDPRDAETLAAATRALPAGASVVCLGELSHHALPEAYAMADAFVLASSAEGMPNALLEGMATGLPCLASDIPGSRDILRGGGGRLFPPGNVRALAQELASLVDDPAASAALGREGREVVLERYSLDRLAEQYGDHYRALLGVC